MAHIIVPEGEAYLDKEIKVLDHGFIRLIDYMRSDARIAQTARVSQLVKAVCPLAYDAFESPYSEWRAFFR